MMQEPSAVTQNLLTLGSLAGWRAWPSCCFRAYARHCPVRQGPGESRFEVPRNDPKRRAVATDEARQNQQSAHDYARLVGKDRSILRRYKDLRMKALKTS
jgi:hypothetical protein